VISDPSGGVRHLEEVIIDLSHALASEPEGESMTLGSGERLRMDRIVSLDGKPRPT
jgi:hypothetical protein